LPTVTTHGVSDYYYCYCYCYCCCCYYYNYYYTNNNGRGVHSDFGKMISKKMKYAKYVPSVL